MRNTYSVTYQQLDTAFRLAWAHNHDWARAVGVEDEDGRARLRDDIADELFGPDLALRPTQTRVETVILAETDLGSPEGIGGILAPEFAGWRIAHTTSSGRLRWSVGPGGELDLFVQRDASVAGGLTGRSIIVLGAACQTTQQWVGTAWQSTATVKVASTPLAELRHWEELAAALRAAGYDPANAVWEHVAQEPEGVWGERETHYYYSRVWPRLAGAFSPSRPDHVSSHFERLVVDAVTGTPLSSRDILALRGHLEAAAGTGLARRFVGGPGEGPVLHEATHPSLGTLRWDTGTDSQGRPSVTLEVAGMGRYYAAGREGLESDMSEYRAQEGLHTRFPYGRPLAIGCERYDYKDGTLTVRLEAGEGSWRLIADDVAPYRLPRDLFEVTDSGEGYMFDNDGRVSLESAEARRELLLLLRDKVPRLPADSMLARMIAGDLAPDSLARTAGRGGVPGAGGPLVGRKGGNDREYRI